MPDQPMHQPLIFLGDEKLNQTTYCLSIVHLLLVDLQSQTQRRGLQPPSVNETAFLLRLLILLRFQPECIDDGEQYSETKTENPGEIPHNKSFP